MKKITACLLALILMLAFTACEAGSNPNETGSETESETLDPMYDGIETGIPMEGNEGMFWKLNDGVMTLFGEGSVSSVPASLYPWFGVEDLVQRVVVSENVTYVGAYALYGIETMLEVTFENGGPTALGTACIGDNRFLKRADLGDSLREIPMELFVRCYDLEEVTIPVSVTRIGAFAFDKCESLKTIRYEGTEEQWNVIVIETGNAELLSAEVIFNCTDAEDTKRETE